MTRRGTPILAAVLLIVAALGSTAPGAAAADNLDTGPLERSIAKSAEGLGVPVKVKCPTVRASAKRFTCTVRIEGQTLHVKVTLSGSNFQGKAVEAQLDIKKMKRLIERTYSQQAASGLPITADCGLPVDQQYLVAKVGSTLTCKIDGEGLETKEVTVRVKSRQGDVTVNWK